MQINVRMQACYHINGFIVASSASNIPLPLQ